MSNDCSKPGVFSWNELMTTDVTVARDFYSGLLGWEIHGMDMGDMTYHVVSMDGKEIAGMMDMPPQAAGAPPHWGGYVTVEDVDAAAEKLVSLGGKILVPPTDIPTVGRFCVFADPQGAVLSLITYLMPEDG